MKIRVSYCGKDSVVELNLRATILDVLKCLDVSPEMVLSSKNGNFVPETEPVGPKDRIEIFKVVSGG